MAAEHATVTAIDELSTLYARPSERVLRTEIYHVDGVGRAFIVVSVEGACQHCPKALVRCDLWGAGSAGRPKGAPTLGDLAAARTPGTDSAAFDADYARRMPSELY